MSWASIYLRIALLMPILTGYLFAAQDVLWLKSGESVPCRIQALTDQIAEVMMESKSPQVAAGRQTISVAQIERIDFGFVEGEKEAFARRGEMPAATLKTWWDYHFAHLHRPRSRTAAWGIAYASALLREKSSNGPGIALAMLDRIIVRAWSPEDVSAAKRVRIQTLVARGELDAAIQEARDFAASTGDSGPMIEVSFQQALADFAALKKLEEENPRWPDDDDIRPQRELLWQRALDLLLQAHLFHPDHETEAARGLFSAAELYLHIGEVEEARARWTDLITLYPGAPQAISSRERIATLASPDTAASDRPLSPNP